MKKKKYPNFPDLYSFEDYKKAHEAKRTFNCGLSPVCLLAPDHHYTIHTNVLKKEDAASAKLEIRTLKLAYAIQVWIKAALISSKNPGPLLYYWWLGYEENETSFNEVKYHKFYADTTPEKMVEGFWKLLEQIADSGEIKVCEGYSCNNEFDWIINKPNLEFYIALDREDVRNAYKDIEDVFQYPYDTTRKSYKWEEIKDLFTQLTLHQLSLMNAKKLHKHSKIDEMLFIACDRLDIEAVKMAIRRGANVNALDERGESALQHAVEYYKSVGIDLRKDYPQEECDRIEAENYKKCMAIIDILLDNGADIDLFGIDGMQPIVCAYYEQDFDIVKYFLEKGSNPNYNSYRCDDLLRRSEVDSHKCTILYCIDSLLSEEYDDRQKNVETLIRNYGGRLYDWDYDPARWQHIGKYYVTIDPTNSKWLFMDNTGWGIGTEDSITIEDAEGNKTTVLLPHIDGLKEWCQDYFQNNTNENYNWHEWNKRGYALAKKVANVLPENVALFYRFGENVELKHYNYGNGRYYLESLWEEIRIDPDK